MPQRRLWSLVTVLMCSTSAGAEMNSAFGDPVHVPAVLVETALIQKALVMTNAIVHGPLTITDMTGDRVERMTFQDVTFEGDVEILLRGRKSEFACEHCTFQGDVKFHFSNMKLIDLRYISVAGNLDLGETRAEAVHLLDSKIAGSLVCEGSDFQRFGIGRSNLAHGANFLGTRFKSFGSANVESAGPIHIRWAQFGDSWLANRIETADMHSQFAAYESPEMPTMLLDQAAAELLSWERDLDGLGYRRDAAEARAAYEGFRRSHLRLSASELAASLLLGLPNRYGSRPYRPFWIALWVVIGFAIGYRISDPFVATKGSGRVRERKPFWLFALLFSLDTFLPFINVAGVKEWGWEVSDRGIWWVTVERILGVAIAAAAAYSVTGL